MSTLVKARYTSPTQFTLSQRDGTYLDVRENDLVTLDEHQWSILKDNDFEFRYQWGDEDPPRTWADGKYMAYTSAVNRVTGYGKQGYLIMRNLIDLGVQLSFFDVRNAAMPSPQDVDAVTRKVLEQTDRPMCEWNLCHSVAETLVELPHKYRIAWSMWEADQLPREETHTIFKAWPEKFNKCEAVIVPATEQKRIFEESGVTVPVHVVHDVVDTNFWNYTPRKRPNRPLTFFSWAYMNARKAPIETVNCFISAFGPDNPDVKLVMKTMGRQFGHGPVFGIPAYNGVTNVQIIDELWSEEHLRDYVRDEVDAGIFMSFGEGFYVPPLESLAMGLPTIVADHSGTHDYCTEGATGKGLYPVQLHHMAEAPQAPEYMRWWVPDWDHTIAQLHNLYNNYDQALADAAKGAKWVQKRWSLEHQRTILERTLGTICH